MTGQTRNKKNELKVFLKQNEKDLASKDTASLPWGGAWRGGGGSGRSLHVAVYADVHLAPVDFGSVHHPAGLLRPLRGVEAHRAAAFGPPVLHLDVGEHHLTCGSHTPEGRGLTEASERPYSPPRETERLIHRLLNSSGSLIYIFKYSY